MYSLTVSMLNREESEVYCPVLRKQENNVSILLYQAVVFGLLPSATLLSSYRLISSCISGVSLRFMTSNLLFGLLIDYFDKEANIAGALIFR